MTCHISPTKHTLQPGYSYLSSYRQDFQHIPSADQRAAVLYNGCGLDARRRNFSSPTQRTFTHTEARQDKSLLQTLSDKYFAQPPPRPSMVKLEGEPQQKTSPSRTAEQATSSQHRVPEVNPRLAPCRADSRNDSTRSHGQQQKDQLSMLSSVRGRSSLMESDVDSYASCTGTPDTGSLFSSRATTPEDDDEVDLTPETMLDRKKREIVDRNMKLFAQLCYWWFARALGLVECAGGKRKRTTDQPSENNLRKSNSNQNLPPGGNQKRQFNNDGNRSGDRGPDGEGDDDDDGGGERAAGKKRAKRDPDEGLKFACPFFKHDSAKYGTQRTCCGPGWENVHRVKEHLYRRHRAPRFVCLRCNEAFRAEDLYRTHQRAATPCSLQDPCAPDGFDEATEKQLRARQKINPQTTERQKWEDVYSILFPDDLIPSPYHDKAEAKADAMDDLAWVEQYMHRELLPKVRHEMEQEVAAELDAVEEKMRKRTLDLAQGMAVRMFQACCAQGFRPLLRPSSIPPPRRSPANPEFGYTTPEVVTVSLSVEQLDEPVLGDDADALNGLPLMETGGYSLDKEGMDFLNQFIDDSTGEVNSMWTLPLENWTTSTV